MHFTLSARWLACIVLCWSACTSPRVGKQPPATDSNDVPVRLTAEIDRLQAVIDSTTNRATVVQDSLQAEISWFRGFLVQDSLTTEEALAHTLDSLQLRIKTLEQDKELLQLALADAQAKQLYQLPGTAAFQVRTSQSTYDCYKVNIKQTPLALFWQNDKGQPLRGFDSLANYLSQQGHELVFATNGGMYKPDSSPQGLFIQEGKELTPIDRRKEEYGNFYMQPNGIFMIDTAQQASIIQTDDFREAEAGRAWYATQSGPMAVINGSINDKFNINSSSKYIRNGVGIIDDEHVVFIISNRQVSLYDFASVFKDHFNCKNALYLDGAISQMYLPELDRLAIRKSNFGPIIGVYK
ncbi:MAG: phosphodiester glycosidase family protein [Verrucomicrobiota bacterium]